MSASAPSTSTNRSAASSSPAERPGGARPGRRILVFGGWFGSRNAGDEAILAALEHLVAEAEPGCRVLAHSIDPEYTRATCGVEPVFAPPGRSRLGKAWALLRAYRSADVFLVSGGTPIFDYFYASRAFHLGIPLLLGKPMVWVGIGTKPVTSRFGRWFYRSLLARARYVGVRDPEVAQRLRAMGVARPLEVTADSAVCLEPDASAPAAALLADAGLDPAAPTIALCPIHLSDDYRRHYHEPVPRATREAAYAALATLADHLVDSGRQVAFLPMHRVAPDDDREAIREVQRRMRHAAPLLLPPEEPRAVAALLGQMALLVGMRLHALVLASARGVPVVGIGFDTKVGSYMDYLGMGDYCASIHGLSAERLVELTETAWRRRDALRAALEARMRSWRALVRDGVRRALERAA
jgi:polysaccharide pyruvyl transferase WcaK-like protein